VKHNLRLTLAVQHTATQRTLAQLGFKGGKRRTVLKIGSTRITVRPVFVNFYPECDGNTFVDKNTTGTLIVDLEGKTK
jgi:hypothetical protein